LYCPAGRFADPRTGLSGQPLDIDMGERLSFDLVHTVMKTLAESGVELPEEAAASFDRNRLENQRHRRAGRTYRPE
jgi:hypothetical protein